MCLHSLLLLLVPPPEGSRMHATCCRTQNTLTHTQVCAPLCYSSPLDPLQTLYPASCLLVNEPLRPLRSCASSFSMEVVVDFLLLCNPSLFSPAPPTPLDPFPALPCASLLALVAVFGRGQLCQLCLYFKGQSRILPPFLSSYAVFVSPHSGNSHPECPDSYPNTVVLFRRGRTPMLESRAFRAWL